MKTNETDTPQTADVPAGAPTAPVVRRAQLYLGRTREAGTGRLLPTRVSLEFDHDGELLSWGLWLGTRFAVLPPDPDAEAYTLEEQEARARDLDR